MNRRFELKTLGALDLKDHRGQRVHSVAKQQKRLALLVFLAVEGLRGPVERDLICGVFWPDYDQDRARANLRNALHYLRKSLGASVIEVIGDERILADAKVLSCDAARALEAGFREVEGDFLEGVHIRGAGADFYDWVDRVRRRIAELPREPRATRTSPPSALTPRIARSPRALVGLAVVGILVTGIVGPSTSRPEEGTLPPISQVDRARRVLVLPFRAESEELELQDIASTGSHWLMRRAIESDVAEIVDYRSIVTRLTDSLHVDLVEAADIAFADLVVTGEVRVSGEEIVVLPRVVRAPLLRTEVTLPGERASLTEPLPAFDRVADAVLAALAVQFSTTWRWPEHRPPPTLEIMRLEQQALDAFYVIDYDRFHALADSVAVKDSTYFSPLMLGHRASAFWNQRYVNSRNFHLSDSTLLFMEANADELSPREARGLKWMRSIVSGDGLSEYEAAADPSIAFASEDRPYRLAMTARRTNRLPLALELIDKRYLMHPRATQYRAWDQVHLRVLARLRDFAGLKVAVREAQTRHATYGLYRRFEAQAHAALGEMEAIDDVIERASVLPPDEEFNIASYLVAAAEVAQAEGYPENARALAGRALEAAERSELADLDLGLVQARAHGVLGQWGAATAFLAEQVGRETPPESRLNLLGLYGAALAKADRPAESRRVIQTLDDWIEEYERFYLAGVARWNQARIHAQLGDVHRALSMLQLALESGQTHGIWQMWDPHFLTLKADPRYQRLVAIKPAG